MNAIKKANKIDYPALASHFRKSIADVQEDLDYNVKVEMNAPKREELRRILNSLIGIKSKPHKGMHTSGRLGNGSRVGQPSRHKTIPEEDYYPERV